ncbi:MAG: hypothetical protein PHG05_04360 [Candidatus Nanoarchaeia archaeon]|nr:hypothetical protein [Candidatus Nanoarchaeia archaeon]
MEKKSLNHIHQRIENNKISDNSSLVIITSLPGSDMGKGTVAAHLLNALEDSNVIKFDGLLNTNCSGRHTARGNDDFGVYEEYNPGRRFGRENYILGGELIKSFIDLYGEGENASFRSYMVNHFLATMGEMFNGLDRPRNLIFEVGGTILDFEVDPFIVPAMKHYKDTLRERCNILLLTKSSFNGYHIKTRDIQSYLTEFGKRLIMPDILLVRDPAEMPLLDDAKRQENELIISNKLEERLGLHFDSNRIITIPFYEKDRIHELGGYLCERLVPLLHKDG